MNKDRRKALAELQERIEALKNELDSAWEDTDAIRSEEQDYADNMPESMQDSEKHDRAEEVVSMLEEAMESIQEAVSGLEEAISKVEEAAE